MDETGAKITQLATITEVADDDLIVGVDVSDTSGSDNGTNKKFTKATLLAGLAPLDPQLTGWNPDAETWVYHNVDDPTGYIKIEDKDVSANYSVGWRIMFTNGGNVIKGIITAITFTDPDTIITFLHEIDPTDNQALTLMTNSAITDNYYSPHKAPQGFPLDPDKWQVLVEDTGNYAATRTNNTWYAPSSANLKIDIPIGKWLVSYRAHVRAAISATNDKYLNAYGSLSTSTSSPSDDYFTVRMGTDGAYSLHANCAVYDRVMTIASKTTYYIICKTNTNGTISPSNGVYASDTTTVIKATCAYL